MKYLTIIVICLCLLGCKEKENDFVIIEPDTVDAELSFVNVDYQDIEFGIGEYDTSIYTNSEGRRIQLNDDGTYKIYEPETMVLIKYMYEPFVFDNVLEND